MTVNKSRTCEPSRAFRRGGGRGQGNGHAHRPSGGPFLKATNALASREPDPSCGRSWEKRKRTSIPVFLPEASSGTALLSRRLGRSPGRPHHGAHGPGATRVGATGHPRGREVREQESDSTDRGREWVAMGTRLLSGGDGTSVSSWAAGYTEGWICHHGSVTTNGAFPCTSVPPEHEAGSQRHRSWTGDGSAADGHSWSHGVDWGGLSVGRRRWGQEGRDTEGTVRCRASGCWCQVPAESPSWATSRWSFHGPVALASVTKTCGPSEPRRAARHGPGPPPGPPGTPRPSSFLPFASMLMCAVFVRSALTNLRAVGL